VSGDRHLEVTDSTTRELRLETLGGFYRFLGAGAFLLAAWTLLDLAAFFGFGIPLALLGFFWIGAASRIEKDEPADIGLRQIAVLAAASLLWLWKVILNLSTKPDFFSRLFLLFLAVAATSIIRAMISGGPPPPRVRTRWVPRPSGR
jgi:hypothetical protein